MDKLKELEKRMDRVKVLMDASGMTIEELLSTAAEKIVQCEKCALYKTCNAYTMDGCYTVWLKFLEEGRIE